MPFVLDASIAACWAFDDEDHPVAALALERVRTDEARVPSLWWFEVRNTLIVSERRGRLTENVLDGTVIGRTMQRHRIRSSSVSSTPSSASFPPARSFTPSSTTMRPQAPRGAEMAGASSALDVPFHADLGLVAQRR